MSESFDKFLENLKDHDDKEITVKQVFSENHPKLHKNESKGEGLTDAFIVDLLNESSNDSSSDSDIDTISSSTSKSFSVINSYSGIKNGISNNDFVFSTDNDNENFENEKVYGKIDLVLTSKSVEQSYEIIKETIQQAVNDVSMSEIESCVKNVASDILSKVETSSLQLDGKKSEVDGINNFNDHREAEEWTDDESASSTSSSDSDDFFEELHKISPPKLNPVKTKGELDIEDLPPIEELNISVEKNELMKVGKVHAVVTKQVVIQAIKDQTPLDMDSVLFLSESEPLGRIFEVFGPVIEPFYVVLFNSTEDIMKKNITVGMEVYFAPKKRDITMYVFIDALRQQKGSDASWADNNEPPEEFLDYSDDEQERAAKLKRRAKNRNREDDDDEVDIISVKSISRREEPASDFNKSNATSQRRLNSNGNSTEKTAQYNYARQTPRSTVASANIRYTSNQPYSTHNTNSLDNVPVWISSPPPFLEMAPISSSAVNVRNTPPSQTINFNQTSTSLSYPKIERSSPVSRNSPQFRIPQVHIRPPVFQTMQPFIPSEAANINAAPVFLQPQNSFNSSQRINNVTSQQAPMVLQSRSPFVPNSVNNSNSHSPQIPILFQSQGSPMNTQHTHIVQPNHSPVQLQSSPMLSNYRQPYVFGQITSMPVISSVPFSPVQTQVAPMHVYASTPPPHMSGNTNHQWQQREGQQTPPLSMTGTANHQWQQREGPQTPPLSMSGTANQHWQQRESLRTSPFNSPLRVQIPSFTNLPPVVRFNASNNTSIPPPKPLYYTASHQNHQFSSRF